MNNNSNKICVVGLGKAGLPLACVIADSGLNILGLDINKEHIDKIANKINPIPEEPGVQEILDLRMGNNFNVTNDPNKAVIECNYFIVIVPLFIDEKTKQPDFSILKSAFTNIGKGLKKGDVVILETTVPPKTTETLIKDILEEESNMKASVDFHLAYSPERIMTGYSISRYKEFPKIVGGLTTRCTDKAFDVYSKFCNKVEKVKNTRTAEMIKITEGVYRDVNIGLANEIFKICEELNVDFWEVKERAENVFCHIHEPGIVGGHCIPVYPWFLINDPNLKTDIMKTARLLSDDMANYYTNKISDIVGSKENVKVAIIGLSYRGGVKEKAYSGSFLLINALKNKGYTVYGVDPLYNSTEIMDIFDIDSIMINNIHEMDGIILLNKINQYKDQLLNNKDKVVDIKNVLGG